MATTSAHVALHAKCHLLQAHCPCRVDEVPMIFHHIAFDSPMCDTEPMYPYISFVLESVALLRLLRGWECSDSLYMHALVHMTYHVSSLLVQAGMGQGLSGVDSVERMHQEYTSAPAALQ